MIEIDRDAAVGLYTLLIRLKANAHTADPTMNFDLTDEWLEYLEDNEPFLTEHRRLEK